MLVVIKLLKELFSNHCLKVEICLALSPRSRLFWISNHSNRDFPSTTATTVRRTVWKVSAISHQTAPHSVKPFHQVSSNLSPQISLTSASASRRQTSISTWPQSATRTITLGHRMWSRVHTCPNMSQWPQHSSTNGTRMTQLKISEWGNLTPSVVLIFSWPIDFDFHRSLLIILLPHLLIITGTLPYFYVNWI